MDLQENNLWTRPLLGKKLKIWQYIGGYDILSNMPQIKLSHQAITKMLKARLPRIKDPKERKVVADFIKKKENEQKRTRTR